MLLVLDDLNLIVKSRSTDPLVVNEQRRWPISHSLFHLVYEVDTLHVFLGLRVITFREHIQVHPELDSLSMEDASGPSAHYLLIVAEVVVLGSDKPTLALFVD